MPELAPVTKIRLPANENGSTLKAQSKAAWLREFGDNALHFTMVFWISDVNDGRLGPQSDVMIAILRKFKETGIAIPCPAAENRAENLLEIQNGFLR